MEIKIRPYHPSDLCTIYKICLQTGNSGKDATGIYKNPELLGHYYAAPYLFFEPDLGFSLMLNGEPVGYILGPRNSEIFSKKTEKAWFPFLRERYSYPDDKDISPDANIIRLIHQGYKFKPELIDYPAHLHIDLLPAGQGKGMGRKLIETFVEKLNDLKVTGLHLEVGKKNVNAIQFYEKVGFSIVKEFDYSIAFGMKLQSG